VIGPSPLGYVSLFAMPDAPLPNALLPNAPLKVLIADKMSDRAADLLLERGVAVDIKTGLPPAELQKILGHYDGLAVRSSSKITAPMLASPRTPAGHWPRRHWR
jgi:hypothetical protein